MSRGHNIQGLADALGEVRMRISALQFEEKQIKSQIAEFGIGSYVGRSHCAGAPSPSLTDPQFGPQHSRCGLFF